MLGRGLHWLMQLPRLIGRISNPQPNAQNAMSCTTCRYFGSPRGLVSCCKTNKRYSDKGEVGGSSPPRPTINRQCLCGYPHFCPLADCRSKSHLPTICQLSGQADKGAIGTFCVCRLPTPSSRGGRQSTGWESLNTTVGSLHRNKDEPDPSGLQERAPGRTAGLKIDTGMRSNTRG